MQIALKNVHTVRARSGKLYFYHRPTRTKLKAEPGTPAFVREVEALNARVAVAQPVGGSVGALLKAYQASPEFGDLAPRTQTDYRRVIDWLKPIEGMPLAQLDSAFLLALRDRAFAAHKRRFANYVVQVVGLISKWGAPRKFPVVPTVAPKLKRSKGAPVANRPWTSSELAAVLAAAPAGIRAAVALGAFAGLREADALSLRWDAYRDGALALRQAKTGEPIWMPAHTTLRAALEDLPHREGVIVRGAQGRPLTPAGFRALFFRLLRALREAGSVGEGLTYHGLRHTVATALAEAGAGTRDIMAITGHQTEAMVATYVRGADNRRRAARAIRRLERAGGGRL